MVVKKYRNRRLYDTDESRYVTLAEVAAKVRAGEDLYVVDAKTGEDLTQPTLAQIILESRGGAGLLPTPLLLRLVRLGDDVLADFLGRYVIWALDLYLAMRQGATSFSPLNPLGNLPFSAGDALARMLSGFPGMGQAPPPPPPPPPEPASEEPPAPEEPSGDMAALRQEMDALRREIAEIKG